MKNLLATFFSNKNYKNLAVLLSLLMFSRCSSSLNGSKKPTGEVAGHIYSDYPLPLILPSGVVLYNNKHRYKYTITSPTNKFRENNEELLFFFKNIKPGKYTLVVGDTIPEVKYIDVFKKERTEPAHFNNDTLKNISVGGDSATLISYSFRGLRYHSFKEMKLPISLLKTTGNIVGSFSVAKYKDIAKCKYRGAYAGIGISGYSGDSLVSRFTTSDSLGNFQFNNMPVGFYKTQAFINCPKVFQRMNGELYDDFQKYETEYFKNILIQPNKVAVVLFNTRIPTLYVLEPNLGFSTYTEWPSNYIDQN